MAWNSIIFHPENSVFYQGLLRENSRDIPDIYIFVHNFKDNFLKGPIQLNMENSGPYKEKNLVL